MRNPLNKLSIYVVSCRTFSARHRSIESQLGACSLDFEYVFEHDLGEAQVCSSPRVSRDLPAPNRSCVLKHLEAQKKFVVSDTDIVLVLEDDCLLAEGFVESLSIVLEKVQSLQPCWLVFLGGADNKLDARFFQSKEVELIESPITTAEAYLLDRAGCAERLQWLSQNEVGLPADHFLKYVDSLLGIRQYRTSRALVSQGSITGEFATTLDASRGKHSLLFLKIKFLFNRFRRQGFPRMFYRLRYFLSR